MIQKENVFVEATHKLSSTSHRIVECCKLRKKKVVTIFNGGNELQSTTCEVIIKSKGDFIKRW